MMDIPEGVLIDKLIHIRQNNEIMYRGLAPCTIVLGITDHDFRDIMDAAIYCLMQKDEMDYKIRKQLLSSEYGFTADLRDQCIHGSVCGGDCATCDDFER